MANKKISEFTALTTPDDADVFPIVDTSATTTKKITWANLVTAITTFVNGLFGPVSLTVAQAQAMAGGTPSYFKPGRLYKITDAYSGVAVINIKAYSTTLLENYGFGTFQNNQMAAAVYCFIWYDLATDNINRVYDPIKNNDVSNSTTGGGNAIDQYKFNDADWLDNRLVDCEINGIYVNNFKNNNMTRCILNLDNSGGDICGNTVLGTDPGDTATTLTIGTDSGACYLTNCLIGGNAVITMTNAHTLKNCTIGAGKTVDLTNISSGYTQTGSVYESNRSTFTITQSDNSAVNPDSSNIIDMAQFPFAGILIVGDISNDLSRFINFPNDHKWMVISAAGDLDINDIGSYIFFNSVFNYASPNFIQQNKDGFVEFMAATTDASAVKITSVFAKS